MNQTTDPMEARPSGLGGAVQHVRPSLPRAHTDLLWHLFLLFWLIAVNLPYYWQFRDLTASRLMKALGYIPW